MRKRNRLFWRLFWAFLSTLMVTAVVLSMLVVVMVRQERSNALENELRVQARDVAKMMQQYDVASFWRRDTALANTLNWKIVEIRESYGAEVWLVSANRKVWVVGDTEYDQAQLNEPAVVAEINKVLSGQEIRVQGLISELGPHIVTVGVPWRDNGGWVGGAVLLHISTESLSVDYSDMIVNAAIATSAAMLLGTALSWIIARRQSDPLRQIQLAVIDFSQGKLDTRVSIQGDQEMMELAGAFNRMAQDLAGLEQSRRSFVANVSHELRSPLTCIRGYVQGLLDGTIPESERDKYLNIVLDETRRLTKLVGELLDLSRIESGTMPLNKSDFDLCELLRVELIKFEGRIDEKDIQVDVALPEGALMVLADGDSIRQVVTNLLDNAVKFTPCGGRISLAAAPEAGGLCRVAVSNTGDGISPEDLPHVFARFYKADKAHTSGKGTGLGLAIVHKILEQHGQKISAASENGHTTFTFYLAMSDNRGNKRETRALP